MRRKDRNLEALERRLGEQGAAFAKLQAELERAKQERDRRSKRGILEGKLGTQKDVDKLIRNKVVGVHNDGGNLALQISTAQGGLGASWLFRWTWTRGPNDYVPKTKGLGSARTVTLDEAREKALEYRRILHDGKDLEQVLINELCDQNASQNRFRTLHQATYDYLNARLKVKGPNNPRGCGEKRRHRVEQELNDYVLNKVHPTLGRVGDLPIQKVDRHMLFNSPDPVDSNNPANWGCGLTALWENQAPTANDLIPHLRHVYAYAKTYGRFVGENPCEKTALEQMLRPYHVVWQIKSHRGVPYELAPAFLLQLRNFYYNCTAHFRVGPDCRPIPVHALEVLMFTCVRVAEIIEAKWKEIDWENLIWSIPPERLKTKVRKGALRATGRPIPITSTVLHNLNDMYTLRDDPNDDEAPIFPSVSGRKHLKLGDQTVLRALRRNLAVLGLKDEDIAAINDHGFRSTLMDWMANKTNYDTRLWSAQVDHEWKDSRYDPALKHYGGDMLLEARRRMMQDYDDYLNSLCGPTADVIKLADRKIGRSA